MATEIVMPRLSDSMEEGTILKWLKQVGDEVALGEELVEIETDKASMVYESDTAGTLVELVAEEGETLPIGATIARVGEAGEAKGEKRKAAGEDEPEKESEEKAEEPEEAAAEAPARTAELERTPERGDGRMKASPIARRLAGELGVKLASLEGSGPGGRVIKKDVEAAAERAPAEREKAPAKTAAAPPSVREAVETAKGEVEVIELSKLQQTIARRMAESKATAPHFYLEVGVDMSQAVALRARLKEVAAEGTVVPSFNDMVVKACAHALREHPRANSAYRDGKVELYSRVNVGVAVAAHEALIVPTVFDADARSLGEIARATRELAGKVREGKITPPELSGGTFTVSNLGMYGIESFAAVINPPQAAILAVGQLRKRAVVDEAGEVVARETMSLNLACDHRVLYGAEAAEFLARIRELLEEPFSLAL